MQTGRGLGAGRVFRGRGGGRNEGESWTHYQYLWVQTHARDHERFILDLTLISDVCSWFGHVVFEVIQSGGFSTD